MFLILLINTFVELRRLYVLGRKEYFRRNSWLWFDLVTKPRRRLDVVRTSLG